MNSSQNASDDHLHARIVDLGDGLFAIDYQVHDNFPSAAIGSKMRVFDYNGSPQADEFRYLTDGHNAYDALHSLGNGEVATLHYHDNGELNFYIIDTSLGAITQTTLVHAFADPQIGNIALVRGSDSFYVTFSDSQKTYISEIGTDGTVLRSTTPISYDGLPASHYELFQVEPISDDVLFAAFSESSTHGLGTFGKFINTTDFSDLEPAPSYGVFTIDAERTLSPSQIINNDDGSISLAVGDYINGVEFKTLDFAFASQPDTEAPVLNSYELLSDQPLGDGDGFGAYYPGDTNTV